MKYTDKDKTKLENFIIDVMYSKMNNESYRAFIFGKEICIAEFRKHKLVMHWIETTVVSDMEIFEILGN